MQNHLDLQDHLHVTQRKPVSVTVLYESSLRQFMHYDLRQKPSEGSVLVRQAIID